MNIEHGRHISDLDELSIPDLGEQREALPTRLKIPLWLVVTAVLVQGCAGSSQAPAPNVDPNDFEPEPFPTNPVENSALAEAKEDFFRTDYESALETLKTALGNSPDDEELLRFQAIVANVAGEHGLELSASARLVELDPNYNNLCALAYAHYGLGDLEKSVEVYNQAIELEPDNPRGYFELARVQLAAGDSSEALVSIQQALELNPADQTARLIAIETALELKLYAEANDHFQTYKERQNGDFDEMDEGLSVKIALAHEVAGEFGKALEIYQGLLKDDPENVDLIKKTIRTLEALSARRAIIPLCQSWISIEPDNPRPHFKLADVLLDKREFHMALAYADTGLDLSPDASDGHFLRGLALEGLRKYSDAIESFEAARDNGKGEIERLADIQVERMEQHRDRKDALQSTR